MLHYFEIAGAGEIIARDTLEEAIETADEIGATLITEIGGSFDEWIKCPFCDEWDISTSITSAGVCRRCQLAIYSRGE